MIFLSNSQGAIVASIPGTVNQGSINANEIILLAPFPSTATVQASFRLPGGLLTYPRLLEVGDTEGNQEETQEGTQEETQEGTQEEYPYTLALGEAFAGKLPKDFNLWKMTMDKALTERAGTLGISFIITTPEWRITTDEATTNIIKGGAYISPSVSEDDYSEIGKILSSMQTALLNAETAQENAEKAQENAVKAASTAQGSEQNATAIWNNMNAYVERMNTHDRQISKVQGDITSLDERVKDLEAINLDYLEVEGDSDTGIVQVPSGFWVGSKAYVNSLGGKTYRLGSLPNNLLEYNEQFGQAVNLASVEIVARTRATKLKSAQAGYIYVLKPNFSGGDTRSIPTTSIQFSGAGTDGFYILGQTNTRVNFPNYDRVTIRGNTAPIILAFDQEASIDYISFYSLGADTVATTVTPILYEYPSDNYGWSKYEYENLLSDEQRAYCVGPFGETYYSFYGWGLDAHEYEPPVFTLSDTKIIGISSHGTNLFDESQIKAVDGDRDGEDWGEPVDDDEGRYLLSNRAFEGVGANKWLGFSMELTPGKYTISANCYVPTDAPTTRVTLGLRTYEPGNAVQDHKYLSNYDTWERTSVTINIEAKGRYFLTAMGKGTGGDPKNYKDLGVRFKEICITKDGSTDYVPFRGVTGVIDRIDVPPQITYLDGYGVSCGSYEQDEYPYNIIPITNKVDFENGVYINEVGEYIFTGNEDMIYDTSNSVDNRETVRIILPFEIGKKPNMFYCSVECDKYTTASNAWAVPSDYPVGYVGVDNDNEVCFCIGKTKTFEEFKEEVKGLRLLYVRKSPIVTPLPIEIDGLIEVEPGGYIEVETDTGRGAPIGVTFVVSKE